MIIIIKTVYLQTNCSHCTCYSCRGSNNVSSKYELYV